eukprot:2344032-Pleurochrysis_carterae.AAC.1
MLAVFGRGGSHTVIVPVLAGQQTVRVQAGRQAAYSQRGKNSHGQVARWRMDGQAAGKWNGGKAGA